MTETGRKHCAERRNCSLRAISPFPTVFSGDLYCRHVKTSDCLGKDLEIYTVGEGEVIYKVTGRNVLYRLNIRIQRPHLPRWVLRGSVVKCLTRNPGVLGSRRTGSSEFFVRVSLGQTLQSPSLVLVKPRKDTNNVKSRRDMTEMLLKPA